MNARRFEPGFQTDFYGLQCFLTAHGYELHGKYLAGFTIAKHGQKPKRLTWPGVIDFVDCIRIGLGLEPIRRNMK